MSRKPLIQVQMLSQARLLAPMRAMVERLAQRCGFENDQAAQISLAVDEALSNIINHGYSRREDGIIWLSAYDPAESGGIEIVLEDEGSQVDPEEIQSRNLEDIRPGGLGVHIIREIMDECEYCRRQPRGMRVTLTKHLPSNDSESQKTSQETHE